MGKLDGRCLCGGVTYTSQAEPAFAAVCHCRNCQRQGGSAFSLVVGVPEDALELDRASLREFVKDDGESATRRYFCGECGSPIYSASPKLPGVIVLKAGTLDDTSWIEPQLEVWGESAQPWVTEVEGRPRLPRSVAEGAAA